MLNLWTKIRAAGNFLHSRTFTVSMLSLVLAFVVFQITATTNRIYITDGEERTVKFTMENKPNAILSEVSTQNLPESNSGFEGLSGHFAQVNLDTVYTASVTVDGVTTDYTVPIGTTVGELLYENGITYDGNDLLSPDSDKPVGDGEEITIERVEYERYTEEEPIPYETVHKNSSLIKLGSSKTIEKGEDGVKTLSYVQRTVDGVKEDVQLLGEHITKPPVTETILVGSPAPVSPIDFDLDVDENGKPVNYSRKLTNQVATGYSAREGAKTASGRYAVPGHVAVNPKEIPYGSRLYIVTEDNKFVYGCAIAADTGIGLMADIVDVDLFYDTYEESVLNGRRIVEIYVLD